MAIKSVTTEREPKTYTLEDTLDFGKYKTVPISSVVEDDPSYLLWCYENISWFDMDSVLEATVHENIDANRNYDDCWPGGGEDIY